MQQRDERYIYHNFNYLRSFSYIADTGSIANAVDHIGRTQPALSQTLKRLETAFDASLFTRSSTGMRLTDAGVVLKARVDAALDRLTGALRDVFGLELADRTRVERSVTAVQLHALISVVSAGDFASAARARGLATPTIHRAARELETQIGAPLFEKTSFGVRPTRTAVQFADTIQLAFADIEQARAEIAAHRGVEAGATTIGAMPMARSYLAPRAVAAFSRVHHNHRVAIVEGVYETLLAGLRCGDIDILIGAARRDQRASDITEEPLFDDPLSILMRPEHPMARSRRANAETLADYPWVAPRQGSPLRRHFETLFDHANGRRPSNVIECNSLSASRILLLEDNRLMLLSDAQAHFELAAGALVSIPLPAQTITRSIVMTRRSDWRPTETQAHLLNFLRDAVVDNSLKS